MREHIARDMTELIGATPLLEAGRFFPGSGGDGCWPSWST